MTKPTFQIGFGNTMTIIAVIAGVLVYYFTATAAAADKVNGVDGRVHVLEDARVGNDKQFDDLSAKVSRIPYIEGKIDAALGRLQINSANVEDKVFTRLVKEQQASATTTP